MLKKPLKLTRDADLQKYNRLWWDQNPMSYDWHKTISSAEGTHEFFAAIDNRFFNASSFYRGKRPFAGLIPFNDIKGKRVLEIGCGLGSHAQLLAEAGCSLVAIDVTPKAVELTRRRLELQGIMADVRLVDAEHMEFEDEEFDFVWSWGVIHHSANPERIMKEVHRVLRPFGEFRLMVYHRSSLQAYTTTIRGALSGKFFKGISTADILSYYSDGYIARFYTRPELSTVLLGCGFSTVTISVLGQKSELIPLPGKGVSGRLKSGLLSMFPDSVAEHILSKFGVFLFAIAMKQHQ
jgi:2-polyprenyl-3-methyl-5-hydroxy-6-metoxy-1,4-benzoquinol methylase